MYVSPCLSFLSLFLLGKENIKLKSVNKFVNNPYVNCMWYSGSDKSWMKDFQLSYFMDVKISDYSRQKNRKRNYLLFIMYIYLKNLEIQNLFFFLLSLFTTRVILFINIPQLKISSVRSHVSPTLTVKLNILGM